jgi:hypothetical protein
LSALALGIHLHPQPHSNINKLDQPSTQPYFTTSHHITSSSLSFIAHHHPTSSSFITHHHQASANITSSFDQHHLKLRSTSPQASINTTSSFDQHQLRQSSSSIFGKQHIHAQLQPSASAAMVLERSWYTIFLLPSPPLSFTWPSLTPFNHQNQTYHPPPRSSIHDPPSSNAPRPHPPFLDPDRGEQQ